MFLSLGLISAVAASSAGGAGDLFSNPMFVQIFPLVAIGGLFYVMIFMPQQRRAKEHAARIASMKRGDTVVLSSGVVGKVVRVEDQEVGLEIAQNVTVKVVKSMIVELRARTEPAPAANANTKS